MEKTVYVVLIEDSVEKVYEDSDEAYRAALDKIISEFGIVDIIESYADRGIRVEECEYVEEESL